MNSTSAVQYHPPFYYSPRPRLIENIPDHLVTLAVPIVAYWVSSLFFHLLDVSGWKWLEKYRIHESAEVKKRNLVSRGEVIVAVIFQQVIQTLMGLVWLEEEVVGRGGSAMTEVVKGLQRWERLVEPAVEALIGLVGGFAKGGFAESRIGAAGKEEIVAKAAYFMYWWGVPAFQFVSAMYVPRSYFFLPLLRSSLCCAFVTWILMLI